MFSVVRRLDFRSPHEHSSPPKCAASACSAPAKRWTVRMRRHVTERCCRRLKSLGWTEGRNLRVDQRAGLGDPDLLRKAAAELVALTPDVIFTNGTATMAPLLQATRTVPIVFTSVADPVGAGFVDSLSRPGGNATGFMQFEYSLAGKWLELLKQVAPGVTRAAVLRDAAITSGTGQFGAIQSVAPSLGVELTPVNMRDAGEIERGIAAFARSGNGGLILTSSALAAVHREQIIALAARHKLPAVYYRRRFVTTGGLISYQFDILDMHRRAAIYVDRIILAARSRPTCRCRRRTNSNW